MGAAVAQGSAAAGPKIGGPAPLRLDEQGREIDELGRPIERRPAAPAAKVIKISRIHLHASLQIFYRCRECNTGKGTYQHQSLQLDKLIALRRQIRKQSPSTQSSQKSGEMRLLVAV